MLQTLASHIVPRTTLDLDSSVLRELRTRAREQRKSLGSVASEILGTALAERRPRRPAPFRWYSQPMGAKVELEDNEAVRRALEER